MIYAIVDIETTGGYAAANGIIEIAIHVFDGEKVVETFETLINPFQSIPSYIQGLTGITDDMVADAPPFEEVSEKIYTLLQGSVFVAHNVNFDYSFVKNHLDYYGYNLSSRKLCSLRLARQIFPGLPSYSLGKLCDSLDIRHSDRHRAGGDAAATVVLFQRMLQADARNVIATSLKKNSKEQALPPNVPKECFERLPSCPGVYYFLDQKGKIIYVGKAKNIKKRVNSHFSNNSARRQKQDFIRHIYSIDFEPCATELMASILEASEIKRLWPDYNQAQKTQEDVYGIFLYEDQSGYMRLVIDKKRRHSTPLYSFTKKIEGHQLLKRLLKEHKLCPKLSYIQIDNEPCVGVHEQYCNGACEKRESPVVYNERVVNAIRSLNSQPSYIIVDRGLKEEEQSCIMIENGKFYGMGYIPRTASYTEKDIIKSSIRPYKDNSVIQHLIQQHLVQNGHQVVFYKD
ncbi:MAG: DNA polymerase III subunit epsilon [Chitinophagaceae bacterium]